MFVHFTEETQFFPFITVQVDLAKETPFKVSQDLESYFCDHASVYILKVTFKSPDWNAKEAMA